MCSHPDVNGPAASPASPALPTDLAAAHAMILTERQARIEAQAAHWFLSLADARSKIEAWRRQYNEGRPHTALGWLAPQEFALAVAQKAAERSPKAHPPAGPKSRERQKPKHSHNGRRRKPGGRQARPSRMPDSTLRWLRKRGSRHSRHRSCHVCRASRPARLRTADWKGGWIRLSFVHAKSVSRLSDSRIDHSQYAVVC